MPTASIKKHIITENAWNRGKAKATKEGYHGNSKYAVAMTIAKQITKSHKRKKNV